MRLARLLAALLSAALLAGCLPSHDPPGSRGQTAGSASGTYCVMGARGFIGDCGIR